MTTPTDTMAANADNRHLSAVVKAARAAGVSLADIRAITDRLPQHGRTVTQIEDAIERVQGKITATASADPDDALLFAAEADDALILADAPATAPLEPEAKEPQCSDLHQAALEYVAQGRAIIPIVPGQKTPMIKGWQENAFTTVEQVDAHWSNNPVSNIAFEPEREGLCVVESDPGSDMVPLNLPATYEVQSPRGGIHYYLKGSLPPSASKLGPHIDTRGRGSYVLIPPSVVNGKGYHALNDLEPAPLPPEIAAKLEPKADAQSSSVDALDLLSNVSKAHTRVADLIARGDVAVQGRGGDNRTYQLACELVRDLGLTVDTALGIIAPWNDKCVPPWEPEELRAKLEHVLAYGQNEAGAYGSERASEVFAHLPKVLGADFHAVIPIPPKYRRAARFPGYATRKQQDSKADDLDWQRSLTTKAQPFTEEEVTELLSTHRFDKRRTVEEMQYTARFAFIASGLRRGHSPQALYDLMMAHGDDRHMASVKGADDPTLALRTEIENVCGTLGDDLDKAVVQIIDGQEAQTVDKIERAIVENNIPLFENDLGVMTPGEFVYKNRRGEDVQTMRLLDVTAPAFTDLLNRSVELQRYNKKEKAMLPVDCPQVIAQNFMKRQGRHMLRPIAGITLIPILRQDGSILNEAGYDVDTGMLFEPCGVTFPDVPAAPSKEDAVAALRFLLAPLRLVPFETEDARAVMASGLLSLLARRIVDNVPLHAFDATAPGSGKTLAVDSASIIASGEPAQHMSLYPNDEENAKGLAALLRQGSPIISYDNVNMPLGFPQLERALTAERPQDRILGLSQTFVATNNAVMFANGNNFAVKGEMHRRTLIARIDTQDEHPERRKFDFNPLTLYRNDRPRYVLAGLTVLRAHILAGLPGRSDMPSGSFDLWSDIVRGALIWLGLGDPIATQARLQDDDTDKGQFAYLLEQWQACGLNEATTADIMKAITASEMGPAQRALGDVIREIVGFKDGKIDMRVFGEYLRKHAGQIVNGRRIEKSGLSNGQRRWKLFGVHHRA